VEFVVLVQKFFANPFQFIKNAPTHFKEYFGHVFPNKEKLLKGIKQTKKVQLLPLPKITKTKNNVEISAILDDFTLRCFESEFNLNLLSKENFPVDLKSHSSEVLLIESSWRGNNLQWQGEIGTYFYNNENELLRKLVKEAKEKSLPTVFWNKEDPVHYNHFVNSAKLFDYVFTTDENSVKKYIANGVKKSFALPFAAQPKLHNPVITKERKHKTCFAGTYWREKYFERQKQLNFLLKPSKKFGLDIYDRNFKNGSSPPQYAFPEIYSENLKGGVPYTEMVDIYKEYQVFLNVNSVNESPTMFSRRVFEILASGTPIISPPNLGISNLIGDDIVLFSSSEEETKKHLERLLSDQMYWKKISLKGIRKVHSEHTYRHRADFILNKVGINKNPESCTEFNIICKIEGKHQLEKLIENIQTQNVSIKIVICVTEKESIDIPNSGLEVIFVKESEVENVLNVINSKCKNDFLHFWDADNFYGTSYLLDFKLASTYSDSQIFGKSSYFNFANKNIEYVNGENEFKFCNNVHFKTLMIKENLVTLQVLKAFFLTGETHFRDTQNRILSLDCFNYVNNFDKQAIDDNIKNRLTV